jgi:hydroxymethylbilane synthase
LSVRRSLSLGTRGSQLALRQAGIVADRLRRQYPKLGLELVTVATRGEGDSRPFARIGEGGLFTTELGAAVATGAVDVAVHSAKDLTGELAPETTIVCVPERAVPADVILGGEGATGEEAVESLSRGAVVGTSSTRRRALLMETRPDLEVVELRGNLDSRLPRIGRDVDAAVVAAAGLERLAPSSLPSCVALDPWTWVPAPGQGALAVQALRERGDLADLFEPLRDATATLELEAEWAFAEAVGGGCSSALGCFARIEREMMEVVAFLGVADGSRCLRRRTRGSARDAAALGRNLADELLREGAGELLAAMRTEAVRPVPAP